MQHCHYAINSKGLSNSVACRRVFVSFNGPQNVKLTLALCGKSIRKMRGLHFNQNSQKRHCKQKKRLSGNQSSRNCVSKQWQLDDTEKVQDLGTPVRECSTLCARHDLIILWQQRWQCIKSKSNKQKCCRCHVFRASAEWPANVYQITGCTLTVAFLKLHPQMNILNKPSQSGRLLQISRPTGLPFLGNRAALKNETILASKGIKRWLIFITEGGD